MKQEFSVDNRSIVTKRTFSFGVEKVWRMWSELPLLEQWWGPHGFTTTSSQFDFSVGGKWVFVMEGPDGQLYPNEIEFDRIEKPGLIHYTHRSNKAFEVQVTLVEESPGSTALTFRMIFGSTEQRDAVKVYAEPGNRQLMDKLDRLLARRGRKPDFQAAIHRHFSAIANRDIGQFESHLTKADRLFTIVQNGYAFTTPAETIATHKQWFGDPRWIWEGEIVHTVEGDDVGMALVKYQYRAKPEDTPVVSWLTYVWRIEDGQWRIVHDQSTALDFPAFARMAGL